MSAQVKVDVEIVDLVEIVEAPEVKKPEKAKEKIVDMPGAVLVRPMNIKAVNTGDLKLDSRYPLNTGTSVSFLLSTTDDAHGIAEVEDSEGNLEIFQGNLGPNLAADKKLSFFRQHNLANNNGRALLSIGCDRLLESGTESIRVKGDIILSFSEKLVTHKSEPIRILPEDEKKKTEEEEKPGEKKIEAAKEQDQADKKLTEKKPEQAGQKEEEKKDAPEKDVPEAKKKANEAVAAAGAARAEVLAQVEAAWAKVGEGNDPITSVIKVGDGELNFKFEPGQSSSSNRISLEALTTMWPQIREVKFSTIDGKKIEARRSGSGSSSRNGVRSLRRYYRMDKDLKVIAVEIVTWGQLKRLRVPFDETVSLNLGSAPKQKVEKEAPGEEKEAPAEAAKDQQPGVAGKPE